MIYLSLGSNLGNRINNLRKAFEILKLRYLTDISYSIIIETEAVLPDRAPIEWNIPYLNMVIKAETELKPAQLLKAIKLIEVEMGRPENYDKWSPRIIDIDILLWNNLETKTDSLEIPHKEIVNRPFLCHLLALMNEGSYKKFEYKDSFINSFTLYPKLVGIVNLTKDSFSDGGKFHHIDKAIEQISKLNSDGASIIEIGAQSTRPGAVIESEENEFKKLKLVLEEIKSEVLKNKIKISIDSFSSINIKKLLYIYPISWINDVRGDLDIETLKQIIEQDCSLCIMHSLSIPPTKDLIIQLDKDPLNIIKLWGGNKIKKLLELGFKNDNIIIDPGIGFGKSVYQNIEILKNIYMLKTLKTKILIGHSRKGYIKAFSNLDAQERDIETIALSLRLADQVDYLRVHNVRDHMRALAIYQSFN